MNWFRSLSLKLSFPLPLLTPYPILSYPTPTYRTTELNQFNSTQCCVEHVDRDRDNEAHKAQTHCEHVRAVRDAQVSVDHPGTREQWGPAPLHGTRGPLLRGTRLLALQAGQAFIIQSVEMAGCRDSSLCYNLLYIYFTPTICII